jgi:hypothetical protein
LSGRALVRLLERGTSFQVFFKRSVLISFWQAWRNRAPRGWCSKSFHLEGGGGRSSRCLRCSIFLSDRRVEEAMTACIVSSSLSLLLSLFACSNRGESSHRYSRCPAAHMSEYWAASSSARSSRSRSCIRRLDRVGGPQVRRWYARLPVGSSALLVVLSKGIRTIGERGLLIGSG